MKRQLLLLLNVLIGLFVVNAQTGVWSGDLEVQGMKLPLVVHLDDENPTIDSPAQGAKGIPIKVSRFEPDGLTIKIPSLGANFSGKYENGKISGTFSQRGVNLLLVLTQGETVLNRPQTPKPPFPYTEEEVSFSNGDAVLKGTLTLPDGWNKKTPVLIMITGSGLQNRDEEVFGHKPFAVIADALARNGIATLRYDDRGFGESSGDVVNCTTEDLKNDALAGIDFLRRRFKKVGALGHSEGGTIALMLGADKKVDFIVSLAGMVVSGKETLLEQNQYALAQAGLPQQTIDEYCELLSMLFDNDDSLPQKLETSNLPVELKQNLKAVEGQMKLPYLQHFVKLDMRDKLRKIACPVLALNGKKDIQVSHKSNLDALTKGLPTNAKNKIQAMDDLNHPLQHCKTGAITEYATIEETVSPEVLDIISQWVKAL